MAKRRLAILRLLRRSPATWPWPATTAAAAVRCSPPGGALRVEGLPSGPDSHRPVLAAGLEGQ